MAVFSPAEAFELFLAAYYHLECAVLPGSREDTLGGLPCLRFAGLDGEADCEVLAWGRAPQDTLACLRTVAPGQKYWLTVCTDCPQDELAVFLAAGYHHRESEALMVRGLAEIDLPADPRVTRVTRADELEAMNEARGYHVFHPAELDDPLTHIYCLAQNDRPLAWGTLLMVRPDVAYVANMFTRPEYRRRGFAHAILATLLAEAAGRGARRSLLVSTFAGYALYRSMDYQALLDCLVLTSP